MTRETLIEEMDKALSENVPGVKFGFSQPIEMRVNELVAGVKSDVAVLIYGPDLDVLRRRPTRSSGCSRGSPAPRTSRRRPRAACRCSGSRSAATSSRGTGSRRPTCSTPSPRWAARPSARCSATRPADWSSRRTRGSRSRSACRSRGGTTPRRSSRSASSTRPAGRSRCATWPTSTFEEGPSEIERENVQRRAVVGVNVRGRDIAGFVAEAQAAIDAKVKLPPGYMIRWGGQFEHLQTASQRLMIVVPIALLLIFLLLFSTFHSLPLAALIYLAVPMAATGGVFALAARGLPFSISAGVGFIALFGVAVLNGLVWVSAVEHLRQEGTSRHARPRARPPWSGSGRS